MSKKKHSKKCKKNPSTEPIIPPCSKYLGNIVPIIVDDLLLFNNQNRLYTFLNTRPANNSPVSYQLVTNLQISLTNFIILYFIEGVIQKKIAYSKDIQIHNDPTINDFIHKSLTTGFNILLDYNTFTRLIVSNSNSIAPLISYSEPISNITYTTVYILHILENNPGLFYGNNNYITDDIINYFFASNNIGCILNNIKK